MSSRMFQHVREEKGLCYSIRTQVDEFTDTGLLTTRAGVKLSDALNAVEAIRQEYDAMATNGVTDEEMEKAKNYLLGKNDLSTEDTEGVAHEYAKNELLYAKQESYEDWKDLVRAVDKSTVERLAKELFQPENFRFAGIGPSVDEDRLNSLIS